MTGISPITSNSERNLELYESLPKTGPTLGEEDLSWPYYSWAYKPPFNFKSK